LTKSFKIIKCHISQHLELGQEIKKVIKGERGIGFKLTLDNNYNMDNKRLTNTAKAIKNKDAINKEYFDTELSIIEDKFISKGQDIDMNDKAIKNLSRPHDNNYPLPKKYLYQYEMLLDSKLNSFNAKVRKL
jgi:hypothetical protein